MIIIPFVFLFQVKSLVFDQSGTYLAVGGSDIRVYICKQWSEVLNFTGEEQKCPSLFKHSSSMHVIWYLLWGSGRFLTLLFFLSNCRSYRIGDWSGLRGERSVPDLCRNGQKSQILQFVEKHTFRMGGRQKKSERRIERSLSEQSLSWTQN